MGAWRCDVMYPQAEKAPSQARSRCVSSGQRLTLDDPLAERVPAQSSGFRNRTPAVAGRAVDPGIDLAE